MHQIHSKKILHTPGGGGGGGATKVFQRIVVWKNLDEKNFRWEKILGDKKILKKKKKKKNSKISTLKISEFFDQIC